MYVLCRERVVSAFYVKPCMFCRERVVSGFYVKPCMFCRERVVSDFYVKPCMFYVENLLLVHFRLALKHTNLNKKLSVCVSVCTFSVNRCTYFHITFWFPFCSHIYFGYNVPCFHFLLTLVRTYIWIYFSLCILFSV